MGSPVKRALVQQRGTTVIGGDAAVSAQLRAISLEYPHSELANATLGWHLSRKLGSGCYGAVFRGELKDGSEVAIKAIDLGALMGKGESPEDAGFDEEVQMLSKFRHPNLVTLLGWGQQGLSRYLVYEFLAGGDVFQRLHKSRQPNTDKLFAWHERLNVSLDAATGLSHMHNSTPKAFHRDIKSANILLDRHGTAKMADFGLSCTSGQTGALHITVKTISGTPGYKCPIYERTGRFTEGSEVYSFGMVLLEVLTGLDPSSADPHQPGGIVYPVAETITPTKPGAIDRCARNLDTSAAWPTTPAHEFGTLALRCVTAHDERTRPHFVEIVRSLRSMLERFPASTTSPPQAPQPQPQPVKAYKAKIIPATKEISAGGVPAVANAVANGGGVSVKVKAAPGSPPSPDRGDEEGQFQLELLMATGLDVESLAPEFRRMPLTMVSGPSDSPGAVASAPVGRNFQPEFFEAWLPDFGQRSCISRKAFEVAWSPGSDAMWLLACGTNPMSVDGKVVTKNSRMPLRPGSEVIFTYELKVLLRLRFSVGTVPVAAAPVVHLASPLLAGVSPGGPLAAAMPGGITVVAKAMEEKVLAPVATRWSVDRTYQLAGEGLEERMSGRVVVLDGVASVSDAVEKLNQGSIRSPGGYCVVFSATKAAYFLLYQPGFREAAFASLGVAEDAGGPEQPPRQVVRMVAPPAPQKLEGLEPPVPQAAVVRMESVPNDGASASTSARSGAISSGGGSSNASAPWRLVCVHAEGLSPDELSALPSDLRDFPLTEGATQVGRHHQPQHFEAWLPDPILRFCVSRTHLDLVTSGNSLILTNRSSNLLCVDHEAVPKGEPRVVSLGQSLSFAKQEGTSTVPFLVLQLRSTDLAEDCAGVSGVPLRASRIVKAACVPASVDVVAVARANAQSSPSRPLVRQAAADVVAAACCRPSGATSSRSRSPERPGRWSTPAMGAPHFANATDDTYHTVAAKAGSPKIILELWGDGVIDVPLSCRTIGPVSLGERPLLVGRRHQRDLHQCAVSEDCLEFLAGDHFCVAYEGNEFWLLALTNRIWRDREGELPVQLARDDLVTLLPGDRIALGTGGDIMSAELARRRLCWHFRRVDKGPECIAVPRNTGEGLSPRRTAAAAGSAARWLSVAARQGGCTAASLDQTSRDAGPQR